MKTLTDRLAQWDLIHRGGVSTCYRAKETALDRWVFVKALNPEFWADSEMRMRFVREARAVSRLDHPNLIHIFEYGEDPDKGPYMLQEWVEGSTLQQLLRGSGPLSPEEVVVLTQQILSGLDALHSAGIIHRDLKPDNVLIRNDGTYLISDFSLAALRNEPRLTHHSAIVGTPAYMSPEQAAGQPPDNRSDLFAAGVVLYESVTGINPFAADDMLEAMRRVRQVQPDFNHAFFQKLPDHLKRLIRQCLEKNPILRPQSAEAALLYLPPEFHATARHRVSKIRVSSPLFRGSALTVLCLVIVLIWFEIHLRNDRSKTPVATSSVKPQSSAGDSTALKPDETIRIAETATPQPRTNSSIQSNPDSKLKPTSSAERKAIGSITGAEPPTASPADSVNVFFDIQPWAHILFHGTHIGTTPMRTPVRMPRGQQILTFQNSAFPPLELPILIDQDAAQIQVNLGQYVTALNFAITPWGDVYVDDAYAGTTPLEQPLFLLPGSHHVRIVHPDYSAVNRSIQAAAGDTLTFDVNFDTYEAILFQGQTSSH